MSINYFRISSRNSVEAGYIQLIESWLTALHKIRPPDRYPYRPYGELVDIGTGGQVGRGSPSVVWFWNRLEFWEYDLLTQIIRDSNWATIYLTTDLGPNELYARNSWADVSAVPLIPSAEPGPKALFLTNVTLTFNKVTILNNPATGL